MWLWGLPHPPPLRNVPFIITWTFTVMLRINFECYVFICVLCYNDALRFRSYVIGFALRGLLFSLRGMFMLLSDQRWSRWEWQTLPTLLSLLVVVQMFVGLAHEIADRIAFEHFFSRSRFWEPQDINLTQVADPPPPTYYGRNNNLMETLNNVAKRTRCRQFVRLMVCYNVQKSP